MSAVSSKLRETAPDDMDIQDVLDELDLDGLPYKDDVSLVKQRQSLTMTVFADAWRDAGHTLSNPGTVQVYWFEGSDMLLVDLNHE